MCVDFLRKILGYNKQNIRLPKKQKKEYTPADEQFGRINFGIRKK